MRDMDKYREYQKKWRAANKEYQKDWKDKNPEYHKTWLSRNKTHHNKLAKRWKQLNPDKMTSSQRKSYVKYRYGLTIEQVEQIRISQNNKCAICEKEDTRYIDHCHSTDVVRGLLCPACNSGLGLFRDNIDLLNKAITYLQKSKQSTKEQ